MASRIADMPLPPDRFNFFLLRHHALGGGFEIERGRDRFAQCRSDLVANALGGAPQRVVVEMRVSLRGGRLGVAEQLADNRQTEARAGPDASVRVLQVVNSNTMKLCTAHYRLPWTLEAGTGLFLFVGARALIGARSQPW
jgi:hypothetical protein